MNAEFAVRLAGVFLLILAAMHIFVPRALGWRDDLARLTLVNRRIFQVHCFFIVLTVVMMGILSLFFARTLLEPNTLARAVLFGLIAFWSARLIVQWFVYDSTLWRGSRPRTAAHLLLTALWAYLVFAYAWAFTKVV